MIKDEQVFLGHILESIDAIESYILGMDFQKFETNRLIQDAVFRNLEIIGEATKNIPSTFKSKHSNIPWKNMAGLRDKLIHNYIAVNLHTIWNTIDSELPGVKAEIEKLLS